MHNRKAASASQLQSQRESSKMATSFQYPTTSLSKELTQLIPIEIYEYIISFLDHSPTSKSCSLTCRSWLQASWKRLFAGTILMVHRENIDDLLEIVERDAHFMTIIRFVRGLYLEQGGSLRLPTWSDSEERDKYKEAFQFDKYLPLLVGFKSVRMLKLGWIRGDTGPPTALSLQNNFGVGVTALELNSVILSSPSQFFEILRALPRLTSLMLVGLKFNSGRPSEDAREAPGMTLVDTPKPPQLQELYCNVTEDIADFVFSWFAFHGPIPIETVAVGLFNGSTNSKVSRFLFESGSTIDTVKIWDAYSQDDFDLSPCVRMRTLRMGWIHLSSSSPPGSETFVTDVLKTVSSPYLEEITVVLQILVSNSPGVESDLGAFDWRGLMSVLQQPHFRNLRKFCLSVSSHTRVVKQALMKHINPVIASGKLPFNPDVFHVVAWSRTEFRGHW
ncbi:hypothetical protein C8J55DRAFT_567143 [Lentinula edodes]|uniref:F-box domain-containing protein n=1 Tax=Lentinula lateritia TaxID=40482 RepID=A0A9W9DDK2_9AGAR|nr:hypothetical protein C8J55DRAFT_567143 [Lentinula edodes]